MATIPSRKATFTEEEKRKLVEGTDAQGKPLSESEKMKLSKMHTARTLGADWREKAAERMKAEEPARAQQALEERAAINRSLAPMEYKLPTKAEEWQTLPSGGRVKIGAETLKRMQGFEKERVGQEQARQEKFQKGLASVQQEARAALKKRYEDELAARGFAPPKTREEAEAISRAKMDEFRAVSEARNLAKEKLNTSQKDYKFYNSLAAQAMASGNTKQAEDLMRAAQATGGSIKNYSARRKFLEDQEMSKARALISEKTKARIAKTQAQNTSNPEASSFTPTATAAPLAVAADTLSYGLPRATPAGPTEQPFGMITPSQAKEYLPSYLGSTGEQATRSIDVQDFSSISPYNPSETRITETEAEIVRPETRSAMPATKTSKQQTIEDVLPGASKMPVVQRNPRETPAQHNARVMQEYEKNVVIPSFNKQTQDALMSATELNKQKDELFSQRFTSPERSKQYKDVSEKASKQQDVLKKSIDKLRAEKRNMAKYPMNSKERQFIDLQIATLQNQLGFIAKRLY